MTTILNEGAACIWWLIFCIQSGTLWGYFRYFLMFKYLPVRSPLLIVNCLFLCFAGDNIAVWISSGRVRPPLRCPPHSCPLPTAATALIHAY